MVQELAELITDGVDSVLQDYPVIVWQLLATILLAVVVGLLFWKPITKFIEKQTKDAEKELNEAKEAKEKAIDLKEKLDTEYSKMKEELVKHRKKLLNEAELEKERILKDAKEEATRKREELKLELAGEVLAQEEAIKKAIKEIALLAASKLLERNLTSKEDEELLEKIIEEIGGIDSASN